MHIQAVAFDMDGLLFDTERLAVESWLEAGRQLGVPIERDIVLLTLGLDRDGTRRVFEQQYGTAYDYDRIREVRLACCYDSIERHGMPLKPGVRTLLDFLDARGVRYALATSTNQERAERYLRSANLETRFHAVVCGDMVAAGKPAPDIYQAACAQLQVEPCRCAAFEDAPAGIVSAYRAGCLPVMVPDLVQPDEQTAALLYARFDRLDEAIRLWDDAPQDKPRDKGIGIP